MSMKSMIVPALLAGLMISATGIGYGTAQAQTTEIKVSLFTPPINPFSVEMERIAKELDSQTGGKLKLSIFHASQLGPAPRQFDLIRTGVADMAVVFQGLTPGRFPMTQVAELPGLVRNAGQPVAMALQDQLQEFLATEYPGTKVLGFSITPNPMLISRVPLTSLADLKGKRLRHPGPVHSATLSALGAVPTLVQPFEMAEALRRGQIDGAVTGYGGAMSFKMEEFAREVLEMPTGGLVFAVVMNAEAYERIPADLRKIFDQHFGPAAQSSWGRLLDADEANRRAHFVKLGINIRSLNEKDLAAFNSIATKVQEATVEELEKKGLPARAYFEKLTKSIAKYE